MNFWEAILAIHVNAFTFLFYQVSTHWFYILAFTAIGYLFWQDLKEQDTKYVYDNRRML